MSLQIQGERAHNPASPGAGRSLVPPSEGIAGLAMADDGSLDAPAPEFEAALVPMLEAVVDMAGAAAGTVRIVTANGANLEPGIAVGLPASMGRTGIGAIAFWCDRCATTKNPDGDCENGRRRAAMTRLAADFFGPVCRHVVAVPLRFRGTAVGTLDLLYETEHALPAETMGLLRAAGEMIGVAIENARATRENLRSHLMSERQTMANEVHDSLAQGLTYMRMRMSLLRGAVESGDEPSAVKFCSDVDDSLTNAHRRLRELITYFRSRMDPQGLQHALAETARTFPDRTGVALAFDNAVPELRLQVGREIEVFHIVQEALANISRHANAVRARLTLDRVAGGYEIVIEDDGIGMPADAVDGDLGDSEHYGIAIMSERARRLGGELTMEVAAGSGTRVRLRFPAVQPQIESRA